MMSGKTGRLAGKVAIVVGSTSGIGAETARRFAAEGAMVVVSGRRTDQGDAVVKAILDEGGQAVFQQTDVRDPKQCRSLCQRAEDEFGGLDSLVYSSGIFHRASFDEISPEFWDDMQAINVRGAFFCCQAAAPLMRKRNGGSITTIGSIHPFIQSDNMIVYGVSKGALLAMTRKLAGTLRKDRIRVNWITVGWVKTEMEESIHTTEHGDLQRITRFDTSAPWGLNTEDDVALGCVYLASDDAIRVTGTNLNISGGIHITL